jgi:hypothetical protein
MSHKLNLEYLPFTEVLIYPVLDLKMFITGFLIYGLLLLKMLPVVIDILNHAFDIQDI